MLFHNIGGPVPSPLTSQFDPLRFKPLTGTAPSDSLNLEKCSVQTFPLASTLAKADPKTLPLLPQTATLARLQGGTAASLLQFTPRSSSTPAKPAPKPAPKTEEKKDEGNFLQIGLRWLGDTAGAAVRGVGDVAGTVVGEAVKNNPLALVSRASSGVAGMMGAPKEVTEALAAVDKGSGAAGDVAKSAVRGVGEFGASTVEGVTTIAADPLAAATGIGIMATSAAEAVPLLGDLTSGAEAAIRGTSTETIRQEKQNNRQAIWDGMVSEHKEVEGRIGAVGAWVKVGLDVGTIVKSGTVQGGKTAARVGANLADDLADVSVKVGRAGDDVAETSARASRTGDEVVAKKVAQDELVAQRHSVPPAGNTTPSGGPARSSKPASVVKDDVVEEYRHYYPKKPEGRDSRLDVNVDDMAQRMAKMAEDIRGFNPTAKNIYSTSEIRVIDQHVKTLLKNAERDGRVPRSMFDDPEVEKVTGWLVAQELKASGLGMSERTLKNYMPYKVTADEVVDSGGMSRTLINTEQDKGVLTAASFILARRALQKTPDSLTSAGRDIKVFNADARQMFILGKASDEIAQYAPKLHAKMGEVHFERFIESKALRQNEHIDGGGNYVDRSLAYAGGTEGHIIDGMKDTFGNTVVIKAKPQDTGTKSIEQWTKVFGKGNIPDHLLGVSKMSGTIFHEAAHLLDPKGAISLAQDSPFGKGVKMAGQRGDDFVSEYAQTMPQEDFAETVRFVIELQTQKTPELLGERPVSDAMRAKLLAATDAIGASPDVLKILPGW